MPDLVEHAEHRLVGPTVQRPVQRGRRSRHGRVGIDVRAADAAHRARAAVLLMVDVQDKEHIERPFECRIDLVLQLRHPEQHVEEVAGEAEFVVGLIVGPPDAVAEGVRRNRGNFGDQALDLLLPRLLIEDLLGVGIERRERADGTQEHAHRMRVVLEPFHQLLDVLVKHRV